MTDTLQGLEISRLQEQLADMATQLRKKSEIASTLDGLVNEIVSGGYLDRHPNQKARVQAIRAAGVEL